MSSLKSKISQVMQALLVQKKRREEEAEEEEEGMVGGISRFTDTQGRTTCWL